MAATYYLDSNAAGGGAGTLASPYNGFTDVNLLTGDLTGVLILLKRGSRFRARLAINDASGFTVDAYGDEDLPAPIIDGSDVTAAAWTAEGSRWYLPAQTLSQCIFINGTRLTPVATKNEVTAGFSWFDDPNDRIYVRLAGDANPNLAALVEITARTTCFNPTDSTDWVCRNIKCQRSRAVNFAMNGVTSRSLVEDCESADGGCGDSTTLGQSNFAWYGTDDDNRAEDCIARRITSHGALNTSMEAGWCRNLTFEDCVCYANGQGLEFFRPIDGATIQRNLVRDIVPLGSTQGHGNGILLVSDEFGADAGGCEDFRIHSNVFSKTWRPCMELNAGLGHQVFNNLFVDGDQRYVTALTDDTGCQVSIDKRGTEEIGVTLKNNLIVSLSTQTSTKAIIVTADSLDVVMDYNLYYGTEPKDLSHWDWKGTSYATLAAFQAASQQELHGQHPTAVGSDVNPLFVDVLDFNGTRDYHPLVSSPGYRAGNPGVSPELDLDRFVFVKPPNIGPYTNPVIGAPRATGFARVSVPPVGRAGRPA